MIIVASVSCIYGIGSPETYADMAIKLTVGERRVQDKFIRLLTDIQYKRNDVDFARGTFRVRGDVVDIFRQVKTLRFAWNSLAMRLNG